MLTLPELVKKYLRAQTFVIHERSGQIEADLLALRAEVEDEINPLLEAVGAVTLYPAAEVPIASLDWE